LRGFRQPLTRLSIGPVQSGDLSPLGTFEASLEDLFIGRGAVIHDIAPITRLRQLQWLSLPGAGWSDIEFVRHLPQLQRLRLSELNDVTDLSPLKTQLSLTWLAVDDCPALGDIDDLPPLGQLGYLSVASSSLPPVGGVIAERAPELRNLVVIRSSAADDLAPLSALPLQHLGLWGCTGITDFTPLAGMSDLRFLDLEDTAIGSLAPISRVSKLETLWLRNCGNVTDLAPLAALKKLRRVWIAGIAPGVDLAPLASSRATVYIAAGQEVRNRQALGRRLQEG
jgi:Leucine-rich repeat (LRR) protein